MALPSPKNKMYRIINNNGNTGSTNCSPSSKIVLGGWFAMCSLKYTVKAKAVKAKAMANAEHSHGQDWPCAFVTDHNRGQVRPCLITVMVSTDHRHGQD